MSPPTTGSSTTPTTDRPEGRSERAPGGRPGSRPASQAALLRQVAIDKGEALNKVIEQGQEETHG